MKCIDLTGTWAVADKGKRYSIPATVPGCIHTDLLASGKIEDPYYADNELKQLWIGETDWKYSRSFTVDSDILESDRIDLVCDGLDTLADIRINGKSVAKTDNSFRTWRFDVQRLVKSGKNTIDILFSSTIPYINRMQKRRYLP